MANRHSFKSDVSFLEKIAMGATGTRRVFEDLQEQGHHPIELERGSMSFKIWKAIKIKRIRVPDILCITCGKRVESRAKATFEISMSHSFSDPERGWDYGLDDDDMIALVVCKRSGDRPVDWEAERLVQYIYVRDLREEYNTGSVVSVRPKGSQEGFEARVIWPACVASADGVVSQITDVHIKYQRQSDGKNLFRRISKQGLTMTPLVGEGDIVKTNQVLASVTPVETEFGCSAKVREVDYTEQLFSPSLSERYKAAKALSFFSEEGSMKALAEKIGDNHEHIYVRLEAAASLSRRGDQRGVLFIERCLNDPYLENRLETVIVLGEIRQQSATKILIETLSNNRQHPEIRAGAAWALGELHQKSALEVLIQSFMEVDEGIRMEAARALAKLGEEYTPEIINEFARNGSAIRPGIAWALSKSGLFNIDELLSSLVDDDARHWIAYIIGTQNPDSFIKQIEALRLLDSEVYFAVTVLWKIMSSWIYGLEEYG